jgi:hypothetical protein
MGSKQIAPKAPKKEKGSFKKSKQKTAYQLEREAAKSAKKSKTSSVFKKK